jgi:hypothetical protein
MHDQITLSDGSVFVRLLVQRAKGVDRAAACSLQKWFVSLQPLCSQSIFDCKQCGIDLKKQPCPRVQASHKKEPATITIGENEVRFNW